MRRYRLLALPAALACVVALLAACGGGEHTDPTKSTSSATGWPRTVNVPGTGPVTVKHRPTRVAVLSSSAAEAVVELVGPSRMVTTMQYNLHPTSSNNYAAMKKVPNALPFTAADDPEKILSYNPDMVVTTPETASQRSALKQISAAGVPVINIDNYWPTMTQVQANLALLGQALGAESQAKRIVGSMKDKLTTVHTAVAGLKTKPSVLVLEAFGADKPYIIGSGTLIDDILQHAGCTSAGTALHLGSSDPADPEVVVKSDPDAILLVNMEGRGRADYQSLLHNPAVAGLSAVRDNRVHLLDSKVASSSSIDHSVDGLTEIAQWLHPEQMRKAQ